MLKQFYKIATPWAKANKIQIIKNRLLGRVINYIYPVYCKLVDNKEGQNYHREIIVSLTSFPERINKLHLVIESLLRQKIKADKIILWLAVTQFPDKNLLPKNLLNMEKRGLEIRFCEDSRSYKKILHTAQMYSDRIIITADDDTFYPEDWIEGLINTYENNKDCVVCYRAHEITFDSNFNVLPYKQWNSLSPDIKGPSQILVPIGVGGILYPENFFDGIDIDINIIKKLSPTSDDLWLKVIGLLKNKKAIKVNENSIEWFTVKSSQKISLKNVNASNGNNNDIAFNNLINYYSIDFSKIINK